MRIQGRDCTLTVSRDGELTPLPYSEETVRLTSKGYVLPECIGKRNREKTVITHKEIEGCFITRLDYSVIQCLFLLFFYDNESFDLYADRGFEKIIYRNVNFKAFELRGINNEAFKLRVDVKSSEESFTENWPMNVPELSWQKQRTFFFDGHSVIADLQTLPLVYRFELAADYKSDTRIALKLYFPLSAEHYPLSSKIEKLTIWIDMKEGILLDLYDLVPISDLCDINCADTVLCNQLFKVTGIMVLNIRNAEQNLQIVI